MIDISRPLAPTMAIWPGSAGVRTRQTLDLASGADANVSELTLDVHTGTHVDAPRHTLLNGPPMGSIALERLIGPAQVVEVRGTRSIGPDELEATVPTGTTRLLLKTDNGGLDGWDPDFAALTVEGARWVVDRGIDLIGVDGWSVQRFGGDPETHNVMLRAAVVLLEGLDLREVRPGGYRLVCLPLSVPALEAAPARAILEPLVELPRGLAAQEQC